MASLFRFCLLTSGFVFIMLLKLNAQVIVDCGSQRYDQQVFSAVDIFTNVLYGSNINSNNVTENLIMDIYQPSGDTISYRPLIVWVHGGSFVTGTKNDPDIVALCNTFAKRGYVCASISYRLGIPFPVSETGATNAVWRAVQDMKAAVRFFRKDAATVNQFKIDSDLIFGGGSSAGAFTALHLAYMNEISEIPALIDTNQVGNLEGESGNPGYRSEINAVINLCGALGFKEYIKPGDIPLCSMHGTNDQTVPYATDTIYLFGIYPLMEVDGSYSVNEYADLIGVPNVMYTYYGSGHVPYLNNSAYMDTTVRFVSNFLYDYLSCQPRDPNPLPNTFGITGLISSANNKLPLVYPNPFKDVCFINSSLPVDELQIFNLAGQNVFSKKLNAETKISLDRTSLVPGFYILNLKSGNTEQRIKICVE